MLRYFLKTPPLKKIWQFQDRICFFLLKTFSASVWWGNTKSSFKENARTFSKSSTTQEKVVEKENFEPKIKAMLELLQSELYQLENKQAKGFKLGADNR